MNHFTLFAHGADFDVDAFLKTTSLTFDKVWHRGDLRGCPDMFQDEHPTSGIEKELGPGRQLTTEEQDRIATDFLEGNQAELRALAQFPGVDTFILGLHCRIEIYPNVCGFCLSPSSRLMYFAVCIGIVPTFYVDLERKDFDDEYPPIRTISDDR